MVLGFFTILIISNQKLLVIKTFICFSDLVFPDKKPKDIVQDDEDPKGKDTNPDDVKNWVDKNPEIGKMQKEVFDDIFDTTDEDEDEERKGEIFGEIKFFLSSKGRLISECHFSFSKFSKKPTKIFDKFLPQNL